MPNKHALVQDRILSVAASKQHKNNGMLECHSAFIFSNERNATNSYHGQYFSAGFAGLKQTGI